MNSEVKNGSVRELVILGAPKHLREGITRPIINFESAYFFYIFTPIYKYISTAHRNIEFAFVFWESQTALIASRFVAFKSKPAGCIS